MASTDRLFPIGERGQQQEMYQQRADCQDETHQQDRDSSVDSFVASSHPRSLYYRILRKYVRLGEYWIPEMVSFAMASGLLGIHYYLLRRYDLSPVSEWDENPINLVFTTLSSVISLLSVLMRGAIGFPVASAIGQLKWHRYRGRSQTLTEFDRFDSASRGITGSVAFLLSGNFLSLASMGCLIIISGVFFGPSLQNTVQTTTMLRDANGEKPLLKVTGTYDQYNAKRRNNDTPQLVVATAMMQANIARAWSYGLSYESGPPDSVTDKVHPDCPESKTCEWTNWSTLELESSCVQVDASIDSFGTASSREANVSTEREIDDNGKTSKVQTILNMEVARDVPSSSVFALRGFSDDHAVLAHVGVIGHWGKNEDPEAIECVLYWQAVQGTSKWQDGRAANSMTEASSSYAKNNNASLSSEDRPFGYHNITITAPWACNFNTSQEESQGPSDDVCDYTVTDKAQRGLWNTLRPYLSGYTMFRNHTSGSEYFTGSNQANDLLMWDWIDERQLLSGPQNALNEVVSRQMDNIATYASATMRKESLSVTQGKLLEYTNCFKVSYDYLAVPGSILALSVLFFVLAAVCTRRQKAWRNSQLPFLYHGLEHTGPNEWRGMRMTAMWEAASDTRVRLETDQDKSGFRLKRYRDLPETTEVESGYSRVSMTPQMAQR